MHPVCVIRYWVCVCVHAFVPRCWPYTWLRRGMRWTACQPGCQPRRQASPRRTAWMSSVSAENVMYCTVRVKAAGGQGTCNHNNLLFVLVVVGVESVTAWGAKLDAEKDVEDRIFFCDDEFLFLNFKCGGVLVFSELFWENELIFQGILKLVYETRTVECSTYVYWDQVYLFSIAFKKDNTVFVQTEPAGGNSTLLHLWRGDLRVINISFQWITVSCCWRHCLSTGHAQYHMKKTKEGRGLREAQWPTRMALPPSLGTIISLFHHTHLSSSGERECVCMRVCECVSIIH